MKVIIEVVATNMVSGHVAINQHTVPILENVPSKRAKELYQKVLEEYRNSERTNKVGDILITRTITVLPN